LKTDPHFVQWIGASCVAKVACSEELFIASDRLKPKFINYNDHLAQIVKQLNEEQALLQPAGDLSVE